MGNDASRVEVPQDGRRTNDDYDDPLPIAASAEGVQPPSQGVPHPTYWFPDGTLRITVNDVCFKVHSPLLTRHSPALQSGGAAVNWTSALEDDPAGRRLSVAGVEALLAHLYHDIPLARTKDVAHVAALIRTSGPEALDFPAVHGLAREALEALVPSDPLKLAERLACPDTALGVGAVYEALQVATEFDMQSMRKTILYWLVTTHHFQDDDEAPNPDSPMAPSVPTGESLHANPDAHDNSRISAHDNSRISAHDKALCAHLLTQIIAHFTPILYTPATAAHMPCTDALADLWMPLVIGPSYADDGVYRPLESLERIKLVQWERGGREEGDRAPAAEGAEEKDASDAEEPLAESWLSIDTVTGRTPSPNPIKEEKPTVCCECAQEKRAEWTKEQEEVWRLVGVWIDEFKWEGEEGK